MHGSHTYSSKPFFYPLAQQTSRSTLNWGLKGGVGQAYLQACNIELGVQGGGGKHTFKHGLESGFGHGAAHQAEH